MAVAEADTKQTAGVFLMKLETMSQEEEHDASSFGKERESCCVNSLLNGIIRTK